MIFYHFTALEYLPAIREEGLTRGEVPLAAHEVLNAVWLTTDPHPGGHGLSPARLLTAEECGFLGVELGAHFPDKRAVRITVTIPQAKVKRWIPWARKRLDPQWLDRLTESGGGIRKAKTWFISFEPIPPEAFREIKTLSSSSPT